MKTRMRRFSSRARLALAGGLALLLGSAGTALGQTAPGIPSGAVWNYMASSDLSFDLELSVTNPAPPPVTRGFLRREVYTNIPYGTVAALTNDPKFPDHPDLVEVVPSFEAPSFWDDNYGQRLVGYLLPPATGNYVFYISSDDQGLLYLSPDENPAHKAVIAREDTWSPARTWNGNSFSTRTNAANISAPIRLEARRSYYVEALHKEAGGGDSLGVAWQLPGESQPPSDGSPPIGGEFLSLEPLPRPLPPQVALLFPANGMLFTVPTNLTLTAQASDPDGWITQVEFFAGEASLGSPPASGASMVWSNVQAGAYVLSARTTDNTGLMATSAPVNITVQAPPPPPITNRELHLVGLYEGMAAAVIVNRPGQRVTLFLSAYRSISWSVTVMPGTILEKVILGGYYPQAAGALPAGVELVRAYCTNSEDGCSDYLWAGYSVESGRFLRVVPRIHELTGLEISSFQGSYRPSGPFVIDRVQDDPRLRSDYPQPVPAADLPDLSFQLAFYTGPVSGSGRLFSRHYTLAGPQDAAGLLPAANRVVPDASQDQYYGLISGEVVQVAAPSATAHPLFLGPEVPELSWPMGMAFDTLRQRALLVSLGGEGFLYGYAPAQDQWSLISSMNNRDFANLEYHPGLDALFGVETCHEDYGPPVVDRLSADGADAGQIRLPMLPFGIGFGGYRAELAAAGHYVVLLLAPGSSYYGAYDQKESRMYLIDPASGQSWLTYRRIGIPTNQPPLVRLSSPTNGATFAGATSLRLEAMASDPDGVVQSVEFFANGVSLGQGLKSSVTTNGGACFSIDWLNLPTEVSTLTARATDAEGAVATSAPVEITVLPIRLPGSLDSTFDITGGGQWPGLGGSTLWLGVAALAAQPDGRILVGGTFSGVNDRLRMSLARLFADGSLDGTFNPGWGLDGAVGNIVLQPDGRILIAGSFNTVQGTPRHGFARFNADGTLDAGFAPDIQPAPIWLAVGSDGRIVISGDFTNVNGLTRPHLARLLPDGSLDPSFDPGAVVGGNVPTRQIAVQPDGRVLAQVLGAWSSWNLIRLNSDGTRDASFEARLVSSTASASVGEFSLLRDGRIAVGYHYSPGSGGWNTLSHLNPNGSLDSTFNPERQPIRDYVSTMLEQPDGKLLLAGSLSLVFGVPRRGLARLNADGSLDAEFNQHDAIGPRPSTGMGPSDVVSSLALLADGRIVVGMEYDFQGGTNGLFQVDANGDRTPAFATALVSKGAQADDLLPLPEGKTLICGFFSSVNAVPRRSLARLNLDGTLDRGFAPDVGGYVNCLARQSEDLILLGGDFTNYNGTPCASLVRIHQDGTLDPTFSMPQPAWAWNGGGGTVGLITLQADGRIIVGGSFDQVNGQPRHFFARLQADGSLDPTLVLDPQQWPQTFGFMCVGAQSDGKVLIGGQYDDYADGFIPYRALVRYHPDGSLDQPFMDRCWVEGNIEHLIIQPDDKILVLGGLRLLLGAVVDGVEVPSPARFNADGTLDTNFISAVAGWGSLALEPDGKVLVNTSEGIARLNPDGSLDAAFHAQLSPWGTDLAQASVIALQPDGQVLISGQFTAVNGVPALNLARLNNSIEPTEPPVITRQPISQAVPLGQTATFSVAAIGTPTLHYQWRKNGVPIVAATNVTLVLPNVQLADAGDYRVLVTNPVGVVTSRTALLTITPAPTHPGAVDPSFRATLDDGGISCLAELPDGRILIGGWFTSIAGVPRSGLARLHHDGSLDRTFDVLLEGTDGPTVDAIALQTDGKVVIGGYFTEVNGMARNCFARLHADGALDPTLAHLPEDGLSLVGVRSLAVQPDGKTLVAFQACDSGDHPVGGVRRCNADGTLDTNYLVRVAGGYGIVAMALQSDGKLLVAGGFARLNGRADDASLARLNVDGSVDARFRPLQGTPQLFDLALQPDGRMLVSGDIWFGPSYGMARLNADGSLDASFNPAIGGIPEVIAVQPNGRILIAGYAVGGAVGERLIRLNRDGSRDHSFDPGTGPRYDVHEETPTVMAMLAEPDGQILVGGEFISFDGAACHGLVRLYGGPPDAPVITKSPASQRCYVGESTMFNVTATGTPPLTYQWQFHTWPIAAATNATLNLSALQVTNSGYYRVIITNVAGAVTSLVAQLEVFEPTTQPGQMDPLFHARLSHRGYVDALAQQPDGRCYVAGFFDQINGVGRGSLARLWPNGDVDLSFVPPPCLTVNALAVQPDGKVLANLGFSGLPSRVVRLQPDGSLDSTFIPYTNAATSVVALQPDSRILVASRSPAQRLVRLHSDGHLDPSFTVMVDGVVVDYGIRAVTALPNGQLLIGGGFNTVNGIARDGVARLNTDGTVDSTFNPIANPDAWVNCLTVLPNRKILIAGGFGWQNGLPRRAIARLNADGSLDPTFDPGKGIGPGDVEIHSIAVQADGRVLIGGNFFQVNGVPRNGLARLYPDGCLDPSFINPAFSTSDDTRMSAIVIQSADMALVAGDDPAYAIGLVRVYLGPMVMPPTMVTQPASRTRFVGQTATFSVEASGTPPLSYQWRKDGVPIATATHATLVVSNAQFSDGGGYSVVVSNAAGLALSSSAILTILPAATHGSAPGDQVEPAVACAGTTYLVVWLDQRASPVAHDIYAARVGLDGRVLDPEGIPISTNPAWKYEPSVASDGTNFLVVWRDSRNNGVLSRQEIFGARVTRDGRVLDPDGIRITRDEVSYRPTVAFNGTDYLVVSCTPEHNGARGGFILGSRVTSTGAVRDLEELVLFQTNYFFTPAVVASGGGDALVAWNSYGTWGRIVHPDGSVERERQLDAAGSTGIRGLAFAGGNYFLATARGRDLINNTAVNDLWGTRISLQGAVQSSFRLCSLTNAALGDGANLTFYSQEGPAVALGGADVYAVWEVGIVYTNNTAQRCRTDIMSLRVTPSNAVLPPVPLCTAPQEQSHAAVAAAALSGNVQLLVVWQDGRVAPPLAPSASPYFDIYGTRLGLAGSPLDTNGFLVSSFASPSFVRRQIGLPSIQLSAAPPAGTSVYAVEDLPPTSWPVSDISHGGVFDTATGKVKFGPFFDAEPRTLSYIALPPVWGMHCAWGVFCFNGQASADGLNSPITGDACVTFAGLFPADLAPPDFQISLNEVTAYGAAWRRGSNWLCHPQGIPIEYVTRAACLWRGGECYTVDALVTNEPLWWVSCSTGSDPATAQGAAVDGLGDAATGDRSRSEVGLTERQMPAGFVPGEALTVAIIATPTSGTRAYAAEDQVPAGWATAGISHDGVFDPASGKIKWGPFLDALPRTLEYQAAPPADARLSGQFAGVVSWDGLRQPIGGREESHPSCRLEIQNRLQEGGFNLALAGVPGSQIQLQVSSDLVTWTPLRVLTNTQGRIEFPDPVTQGTPQRFYRALPME